MKHTFTASVKEQLCRIPADRPCCTLAEAYGILLFATSFTPRGIRHITEQETMERRFPMIMQRAFGVTFDTRSTRATGGRTIFTLTDPVQLERVFGKLGLDVTRVSALRLNRAMLEDDCCCAAFLRGVFLAGGSVADPARRYHLELVTPYYNLSRELVSLLQEMELEPKITLRRANYVLYYKSSESIENFLTLIGAPIYAMRVMSAKVEKDVRNQVNRRVNCEAANIGKTVDAAYNQLRAIERLRASGRLDGLPDELRTVADARTAYPDYALTPLAQTFDPPMRRATLNYRLLKLVELADKPAPGEDEK